MHKFLFLFFLIITGGFFMGYKVSADEKELARVPLDNYLQAHATGNPDLIHKAFQADARITAFVEGKLVNLSVDEFAERFNGKPAADEAQRKRKIESLDVSGNAASAKIVLDYPAVKFTDYMNLLKIDGQWQIVNKTFNAEPKVKSPK